MKRLFNVDVLPRRATSIRLCDKCYPSTVGTSKGIHIQYVYVGCIRCLSECQTVYKCEVYRSPGVLTYLVNKMQPTCCCCLWRHWLLTLTYVLLYWNGKLDSVWGSPLPKIGIIRENVSNKSCWALNSKEKSPLAHVSISPQSGARWLEKIDLIEIL